MKWDLAARFLSHFYHSGTTCGVNLATLASPLQGFGYIFRVKKQTWAQGATTEITYPIWTHAGRHLHVFSHILCKKMCL